MNVPAVGIGFPVYNGGATLEGSLRSLLASDYPRLHIYISDNCSTDQSEDLCRRLTALDSRVTLVRHPINRGAIWNFNHVFEQTSGKYFMWAAHDDLWHPTFISRAVARLEEAPDAAICHSWGQPITSLGQPVGPCYQGWVLDEDLAHERLRRFLTEPWLHAAIYGVMRREAVTRTRLLRPMLASEQVFVGEMALLGKIVQVPAVLQWKRVPDPGTRYHSAAGMAQYLGLGTGRSRRLATRLTPIRLRVSLALVRSVVSLCQDNDRTKAISAIAGAYVRERHWSIDFKEILERLLGEERFTRARLRVRNSRPRRSH